MVKKKIMSGAFVVIFVFAIGLLINTPFKVNIDEKDVLTMNLYVSNMYSHRFEIDDEHKSLLLSWINNADYKKPSTNSMGDMTLTINTGNKIYEFTANRSSNMVWGYVYNYKKSTPFAFESQEISKLFYEVFTQELEGKQLDEILVNSIIKGMY